MGRTKSDKYQAVKTLLQLPKVVIAPLYCVTTDYYLLVLFGIQYSMEESLGLVMIMCLVIGTVLVMHVNTDCNKSWDPDNLPDKSKIIPLTTDSL